MRRMSLVAVLALVCVSVAAPTTETEKAFVDVTSTSGVDALVDSGYAAGDKWWLSGIDLVDLDGDGKLDLFLSAPPAVPRSRRSASAKRVDYPGAKANTTVRISE